MHDCMGCGAKHASMAMPLPGKGGLVGATVLLLSSVCDRSMLIGGALGGVNLHVADQTYTRSPPIPQETHRTLQSWHHRRNSPLTRNLDTRKVDDSANRLLGDRIFSHLILKDVALHVVYL